MSRAPFSPRSPAPPSSSIGFGRQWRRLRGRVTHAVLRVSRTQRGPNPSFSRNWPSEHLGEVRPKSAPEARTSVRTVPVGGKPRRRARGREGCGRGGDQPRVSASRLRALLATVRGAIPSGKPLVWKLLRCHTSKRGAGSPGWVSAPQDPSAAAGAETRAGRPRCPRERPNMTLGSPHAKGANEPPLRGRCEGRRRPRA